MVLKCSARVVFWRVALGGALLLLAFSPNVHAQTWAGSRETPNLRELVAVDRTGEDGWPFGAEDVAGDGLGAFREPEPSFDLRTVYATAVADRFWLRLYVSDERAASVSLVAYVFLDTDRDDSTGGSARAPEIDPALDSDAAAGGYERVVGVQGSGEAPVVFEWENDQQGFVSVPLAVAEFAAEVGRDLDPIRLFTEEHGYLQASVALEVLGVGAACDANLLVRSVEHLDASVARDLDVGELGPCLAADSNDNRVPDIAEPEACTSDRQCSGAGICVEGRCVIAPPCAEEADCESDETCSTDNVCVVVPMGECAENDDCGQLVCIEDQCRSCLEGGSCGPNRSCAPDGRCVDGRSAGDAGAGSEGTTDDPRDLVGPGEEVQGGACTCGLVRRPRDARTALGCLAGTFVLALRRRRWRIRG